MRFAALEEAVRKSCARETAWEARIVAGIGAAIDFATKDVAAQALTVNAGTRSSDAGEDELALISYFGELLDETTPEMLFPISSPEGIVETAAIVIRGHLHAGAPERLPDLGPALVHLTLMPYIGPTDAERWAATFSPAEDS